MTSWLFSIGGFAVALLIAYLYGKRTARLETSEDFTQATIEAKKINEAVADLDDDDLDNELWPDDDERV